MILKHVDFEVPGFGELAAGPAALAGYRSAVMADTPIAYWRLGESSGIVAADETGNHDGTYVNTPTLGQSSPLAFDDDTAVLYDGINEHANVGSLGSLGSSIDTTGLTIEMWLKTTSTGSIVRPLGVRNTSAKQFVFVGVNQQTTAQSNGWVALAYRDDSNKRIFGHANIGASLYDGSWHHLVTTMAVSPDAVEIYFDGVDQSAVITHNDGIVNAVDFNQPVGIGCYLDRGVISSPFPGSLDEFAIYDSVLSAARVKAHYNAGIGRVAA